MSTFFEQVSVQAKAHAKKPALIAANNGTTLTYEQFLRAVEHAQSKLSSLGLPRQAAISIALGNGLEFAVIFAAVVFSSYVAAPLNPAYKQSEFEFYIDDLKSSALFVPKGAVHAKHPAVAAGRAHSAAIVEVGWVGSELVFELMDGQKSSGHTPERNIYSPPKPEDIAFVLHTSGTTGRPKAVPLTHRNMAATVRNIGNTYKLSHKDATYLVMPLFHVHGLLCGLLAPLGSGGTVVVPSKFSATTFWHDFTKFNCNWYTAVPTIHQILLKSDQPRSMPKIRFIRSCSSALAPSVLHELERRFNAPVLEAYAMTEACHQMTSNNLPPGERKPGTVGVGQGVSIAIISEDGRFLRAGEEGEICVKGENVTPGYINNDKANTEAFTVEDYFRTGDQGKLDADGFLTITGRIKELINRAGEKISPIELDAAMLSHPAVAEAVAFGVPDEMYGQQVNAVVVPKSGARVTESELKTFLAETLSKFKVPQKIFFADSMPKTATGKIQRRNIAAKYVKSSKL